MECPRCGRVNGPDRKYCIRCGAPLAVTELEDTGRPQADDTQEPTGSAAETDTWSWEPEGIPQSHEETGEPRGESQAEPKAAVDKGSQAENRHRLARLIVLLLVAGMAVDLVIGLVSCVADGASELLDSGADELSSVLDDAFDDASDQEASPSVDDTPEEALSQAQGYIESGAFSHDGLVEQLEYEGYGEKNATYAADNVGADWSAEALQSAQSYVDHIGISSEHLYEMLDYEKFTPDQIDYAMQNVQVDWYAEAAEDAQDWLDYNDGYTRDELLERLTNDGFSQQQAEYGVMQVGL